MRQGEVYIVGPGPDREAQFLIVSATTFNEQSGSPVVWGVPGENDEYDPVQLTHLDPSLLRTRKGAVHGSTLSQVLDFLAWGFQGTEPYGDATPSSTDVDPGDVVYDSDDQMMVVVSGPGFNATPGNDALWTVAAEESGVVHPHMVMTRTRPELRSTPLQISADGVRRQVDVIVHNILGIN